MRGATAVKAGLVALAIAVAGWLTTIVAVSFASASRTTEDLTAVWTAAGQTPLGGSQTLVVPPGSTMVVFLVGSDLRSLAGTATGTCDATAGGSPIRLGWPVHIQPSLRGGVLGDGQQTVAIKGWTNDTGGAAAVRITCRTGESDVDYVIAVPTQTGTVETNPWFHPWAWVAVGAVGAILIGFAAWNGRNTTQ